MTQTHDWQKEKKKTEVKSVICSPCVSLSYETTYVYV